MVGGGGSGGTNPTTPLSNPMAELRHHHTLKRVPAEVGVVEEFDPDVDWADEALLLGRDGCGGGEEGKEEGVREVHRVARWV